MKQVIKNWVKKLRSGKYEQTTGTLKDETGYCCLGVLRTCLPHSLRSGSKSKDGGVLTEGQLKAAGLTTVRQTKLTTMNDNDFRDFNYIANYIERSL